MQAGEVLSHLRTDRHRFHRESIASELIRGFVVARRPAGLTIKKALIAQTNVDHRLAKNSKTSRTCRASDCSHCAQRYLA